MDEASGLASNRNKAAPTPQRPFLKVLALALWCLMLETEEKLSGQLDLGDFCKIFLKLKQPIFAKKGHCGI